MDFSNIKTPAYIIDEALLTKNLEILAEMQKRANCKILLAQKAFSMQCTYPLISKYLRGTTASGLHELMHAVKYFNGEHHIFSPAFCDDEFDFIAQNATHIVFNSPAQIEKFYERCAGKSSIGLRINPEYSELEHEIYNPAARFSRLGTTLANFDEKILKKIDGLHFHTMCEQGASTLANTLAVVEKKFGRYFKNLKWINFGGGHHITKDDYDRELLVKIITDFKQKYNIEVYLEPGEAVVLNAGFLAANVLEIVQNEMNIAILDASAACHMPDVLEMPYRPEIIGAGQPQAKSHTYRLAGNTCLAGDIIGDYSFDEPLKIGQKLIFCDMAHYSFCKNNTFNGMKLPSLIYKKSNKECIIVREFDYEDFENRLG